MIPITGLPVKTLRSQPICSARERCPCELRSAPPNQRWLRKSSGRSLERVIQRFPIRVAAARGGPVPEVRPILTSGNVLLADARLAAAHARQLPDARAAGIQVAVDVGIDDARLAAGDALAYRLGKIRRAPDADTRDACRSRHRGEIRVVRLVGAGVLEIGGELAPAEVAALQPPDRAVRVVVPDQVDDRYLVLVRGSQNVGVH